MNVIRSLVSSLCTTRKIRVSIAALGAIAIIAAAFVTSKPAFAWSNSTNSPTLPYTSDYLQTRTYVSPQYCKYWWGDCGWFYAVSSSWLWGTNPEIAYYISDTDTIVVNGINISLSTTGGSISSSSTSATFQCVSYNNWYCGNNIYNLRVNTGLLSVWWNTQGNDVTHAIIWNGTTSYYNTASVTAWT